ncbi:MAG: UbiA family prenyltransferase [Candidatus Hodarchaeales archaeon]|jgi:1,4-dihydroxy-2-naphthoate octaprenyltransferase
MGCEIPTIELSDVKGKRFETILIFIIKNRMLIGLLFGFPFMLFGLFTELAIQHWDLTLLADNWMRIIAAIIISICLLPYIWMINDYYDAPFDKLDVKKGERNYFCSSNIQDKPYLAKIMLLTPVIISLSFSIIISIETLFLVSFTLLLGHFYSAPPLRFKERPFFDLITHGLYASGLFFLLGGLIVAPFAFLVQQPLFLVFLMLSIIDGIWLQFNSQLIDLKIDIQGEQQTTSVALGVQKSILLLRGLICSMLLTLTFYLILNTPLRDYLPDIVNQISILLSIFLIFLYLIQSYRLRDNFDSVRKHSAWVRRNFVYIFCIIGILLIN